MIYPFTNINQYLENTKIKEYSGKMVSPKVIHVSHFPEDVHDMVLFKKCCLNQTGILMRDQYLMVGVISKNITLAEQKHNFQMSIYFCNVGNVDLFSFSNRYINSEELTLQKYPQQLQPLIKVQKQLRQDLVISFKDIPYSKQTLNLDYYIGQQQFQKTLSIPIPIVKLFVHQPIDFALYKAKW